MAQPQRFYSHYCHVHGLIYVHCTDTTVIIVYSRFSPRISKRHFGGGGLENRGAHLLRQQRTS